MTDPNMLLGIVDQRSLDNERQIANLTNELHTLRDEHKEDLDKMREEQKAIYDVATSVKVMAEQMHTMNDVMQDTNKKVDVIAQAQIDSEEHLKKKISELENKPAREALETVKKVRMEIILTIVGFLVGGVLATLIKFA